MSDTVPDLSKTTSPWLGQDCAQVVQDLNTAVRKVTDREIRAKKAEANKVEDDYKARKAGGFWDKITAGPLADFKDQAKDALTDPQDSVKGQQSILGKYGEYLDKGLQFAGTAADLVSGVTSNVASEMDVINAVSEASGFGTLLPTGQAAGCDKGLFLGTVGSVIKIAGTAVDNVVNGAVAAQATVGLAMDVVPDLYSALMNLPAGALSILLTNKKVMLERIRTTVSASLDRAIKLEGEDYPFDHRSYVLAQKARLGEADGDLGQVEATLEAGGKFLHEPWRRAEQEVESVAKDLLAISASALMPTAYGKMIQMVGYQKGLELLIKILQDRQAAFDALIRAIGGFKSSLQSSGKFQNFMTPIVQQVRCTLNQIMQDMQVTVDVNALLRYYLKEKGWGIELLATAGFMKHTERLGDDLTIPSTAANDAADALSSGIQSGMDAFVGGESYTRLITYLNSYLSELKRKTVANIKTDLLSSIAAAVNREIEYQLNSNSQVEALLNGFNSSIAEVGLTAIQAVAGLLELLDQQGLDEMVTSLRKGDFNSFFSGDMLKKQAESAARKAIGQVLQCCAANSGDGSVNKKLLKMNRDMQAMQRSKELNDRFTLGYSAKHLKETYDKTIPKLQRMRKDVASIQQAPCINKNNQGSLGSVPLTLY